MSKDPKDSPFVRHVLYTNDVTRLVASFVQSLMTVAPPENVRQALESMLVNWPDRVRHTKEMHEALAAQLGEPSGWPDESKN